MYFLFQLQRCFVHLLRRGKITVLTYESLHFSVYADSFLLICHFFLLLISQMLIYLYLIYFLNVKMVPHGSNLFVYHLHLLLNHPEITFCLV